MPARSSKPVSAGEKAASFKPQASSRIERTMRVAHIQAILPAAEECMAQYGLHCASCSIGGMETLEEGAKMHGMSDADIDDLIADLNILLGQRPARPQTISLTETAARALKEVMANEGKAGWGLQVGLDETGGFSMEFRKDPSTGDKIFSNNAVSEVRLFASSLTLAGIGGATIDLREGRFKLDLPEDAQKKSCACGGKGDCGCGGECGCGH